MACKVLSSFFALYFMCSVAQGKALDSLPIKVLEKIKTSDQMFAPAMHKLLKKLYSNNEWHYFFALAEFIRVKGLNINLKGEEELVSLEMLALAKHCKFDAAMTLAKSINNETAIKRPLIDEAVQVVNLQKEYELRRSKGQKFNNTPLIAKKETYWSVHRNTILKLTHPKNLRKVVKSQCKI